MLRLKPGWSFPTLGRVSTQKAAYEMGDIAPWPTSVLVAARKQPQLRSPSAVLLAMLHAFRFAIIPCMALLLGACKAEPRVAPEPAKKAVKKISAKAKKAAEAAKAAELAKAEAEREPEKFSLPFAWESEKAEPLSQTRAFLREAIT